MDVVNGGFFIAFQHHFFSAGKAYSSDREDDVPDGSISF
ncbi:hypothetical protein [Klebsiella pneumoniae IS39]|nr:hypothetical protein [Klebsiella pneumoniae IS39]